MKIAKNFKISFSGTSLVAGSKSCFNSFPGAEAVIAGLSYRTPPVAVSANFPGVHYLADDTCNVQLLFVIY